MIDNPKGRFLSPASFVYANGLVFFKAKDNPVGEDLWAVEAW
jgi:hypothetical protein